MVLKRYYKNGQVTHVRVIVAKKVQNLSLRFIDMGVKQGWLKMQDGEIIINSEPSRTIYKIMQLPGIFCCFCNLALPEGGFMAQQHVAACHPGHVSPDTNNPAGYRHDVFYRCIKEV